MPDPLFGKALGLIETRGYTALVAATDAAAKYAHVDIVSIQRASGGLVVITLVGDVASVQASVDAGQQEAQRVGELVSAHVIPRPDDSVWKLVNPTNDDTSNRIRPKSKRKAEPKPESVSNSTVEKSETDVPVVPDDSELDTTPVRELRRIARTIANIGLVGREISRAPKAQLLAAIRAAQAQ
jgi:ethanolamine utilization protein EutM